MSELGTIRERLQRSSRFFRELEGVVLTSFNLNVPFLEDQALPAILGVEAKTVAARRAELHQRLGAVPCTVFYDPATGPRFSGTFRYVARPVPVRGRFFHPKLVILAGRCEQGESWVYLSAASANLTLSGWGRNAEAFGETWIHCKQQAAWRSLDALLDWFQRRGSPERPWESSGALARVRAVLQRQPELRRPRDDGHQVWSGLTKARFYCSVVHRRGLAAFLRDGQSRRPTELRAYSPYWGDVASQSAAFDARETILVPALRLNRAFGISQESARDLNGRAEIRRNPEDKGDRFWHMKAYRLAFGSKVFTAIGSCNFTSAGLAGASGNVEAMLVFEDDPDWLLLGDRLDLQDLPEEGQLDDDRPEPVPVAIVVAWDWRGMSWRWWLEPGPGQSDFQLELPGEAPLPIKGSDDRRGSPPARGSSFTLRFRERGEKQEWRGPVVEINLDYSARSYGRPLTATDILDSWRGRDPSWDIAGGGGGDPSDADEVDDERPAAFEAVNLYDLYRSLRGLRTKLEGLRSRPDLLRAYLVGRPDSVLALAHLADREGEALAVRFLVLRELVGLLAPHGELLEADLVDRVRGMTLKARDQTIQALRSESGFSAEDARDALAWFEARLSGLDEEA